MAKGSASGGASGSAAIRAGRAFVELFSDDTALTRGLEAARRKLDGFGRGAMTLGSQLGRDGLTLAAPFAAGMAALVPRAKVMGDLADRYNLTAERVSRLGFAFERSGVGVDEFGSTLDGFASTMFAAADGADESFRRLGLNARNLIKLPLDQQFLAVAGKLGQVTRESDRAVLAQEMFGASGLKLLPVLRQGADGFRRLGEEAERAGGVVSGDEAKAAQEQYRQYTAVVLQLKLAFAEIARAILPGADGIKAFGERVRDAVADVRGFLSANRGAVRGVAATAAGLLAAGAAAKAFGAAAVVLSVGLGVVKVAAGATVAVLGALPVAVGLGVAGGLALAGELGNALGTLRDRLGWTGDGFRELADTAQTAWGGMAAAASAGDFGTAAQIAFTALKLEWLKVEKWWAERWNDLGTKLVEGWKDMVDGMAAALIKGQGALDDFKVGLGVVDSKVSGWMGAEERLVRTGPGQKLDARGLAPPGNRADELMNQLLQMKAEERRFGNNAIDIGKLDRDIEKLTKELERLVNEARRGPAGPGEDLGEVPGGNMFALGLAVQAAAARLAELARKAGLGDESLPRSAKGAFAGPFARQLGVGDQIARRAVILSEQQLAELKGVNNGIQTIGRRLAFK